MNNLTFYILVIRLVTKVDRTHTRGSAYQK